MKHPKYKVIYLKIPPIPLAKNKTCPHAFMRIFSPTFCLCSLKRLLSYLTASLKLKSLKRQNALFYEFPLLLASRFRKALKEFPYHPGRFQCIGALFRGGNENALGSFIRPKGDYGHVMLFINKGISVAPIQSECGM